MKVNCLNCNKQFEKNSYDIKKSPNHYCSRSCSAQRTNRIYKKASKKIRKCKRCKDQYTYDGKISVYCNNCRLEIKENKESLKFKTIEEYQSLPSVINKHPSWKNSHIRNLNRSWNSYMTLLPCAVCGYSLHVELCHIKAINQFPKTALLGEVNSPFNIIQLCRNHHWEFDNGLIKISK